MRKLFLDLANLLVGAVQDTLNERAIRRAVLRQKEINDAYDKGIVYGTQLGTKIGFHLGVQHAAAQCQQLLDSQLPDTPRWKPFREDSESDS